MRRFYVPKTRWKGNRARLSVDQARHIMRVLRMGRGDSIAVFDGDKEYEARIAGADKLGLWCDIINIISPGRVVGAIHESPLQLTLAPALIKRARMDMIIEKTTELGVHNIAPFVSARCVVKPNAARIGHWRKIAESAAAQSGRVRVPEIEEPVSFNDILKIDADLKVMLWEEEKEHGIDEILSRWINLKEKKAAGAMLMVGPEGGFTEDEAASAREHGFILWGLGPATLRAETAAIAGTAILIHALTGRIL